MNKNTGAFLSQSHSFQKMYIFYVQYYEKYSWDGFDIYYIVFTNH